MSLDEKLCEFFDISEEESSALLDNIKSNLKDGKFRFVVLMDTLHERLKDLIVFINQNTRFDIYAVEMEFYKYEDYEITIPRLFGAEVKKGVSEGTKGKTWDEERFLSEVEKTRGIEEKEIIEKIIQWVDDRGLRIWWGSGKQSGSFFPMLDYKDGSYWTFTPWTYGKVQIPFQMIKKHSPSFSEERRLKELQKRLNQINGVDIPDNSFDLYPSFLLSALKSESNLRQFLDVFDWYIQEITAIDK